MKGIGSKLLLSLLGVLIAGIPVWLYLIASNLLNPEGFWQNLVVLGIGLYVLGGFQILFGIGLLVWLWAIWTD